MVASSRGYFVPDQITTPLLLFLLNMNIFRYNKIYRGERYKVQGGDVYKVQGRAVYKVQGPENFSEKGRF